MTMAESISDNQSTNDLIVAAKKIDYDGPLGMTATVEGDKIISKQRTEGEAAFSELRKRGDAVVDSILLEIRKDEMQGILYNNFKRKSIWLFAQIDSEKSRKARKEACLCLLTPDRPGPKNREREELEDRALKKTDWVLRGFEGWNSIRIFCLWSSDMSREKEF